MPFSIRLESLPFAIPEKLRDVLVAFPVETGAGRQVQSGSPLPAVRVWSVLDSEGLAVGNAWINTQSSSGELVRSYLNIAVYAESRTAGAATAILPLVELEMQQSGLDRLFVQVNSSKAETGMRMRHWLMRQGFQLVREDLWTSYQGQSDTEIIQRCTTPLTFVKHL